MQLNRDDKILQEFNNKNIVVVIPCYQVADHIASVIGDLPNYIKTIIAVNDCSYDETGSILDDLTNIDGRLVVIHHAENLGVGAATISGYKRALKLNADVTIKVDGDGQMNPAHIPVILTPILAGRADYSKGNRFHDWKYASTMPLIRKIGNLGLSFLIKGASGYWNVFDPSNGYTAITSDLLRRLNFESIEKRFLFETSMLVEMYYHSAVIHQFPMTAVYEGTQSSLSILRSLFEFPPYLIKAGISRFFRKYVFQDFGALTIFAIFGFLFLLFGVGFGSFHWLRSFITRQPATAGTAILSAVPTIMGFQLLLQAIVLDIQNTPNR